MSLLDTVFGAPLIAEVLHTEPLVYVDVGAAVGVEEPWLTMLRARDLTRVVAFEPLPENFRAIQRQPNGSYHQLAIGAVAGRATFNVHSTLSSLLDRSPAIGAPADRIDVAVETLERLRDDGTIPSLDIVKSDAELTDCNVVEGCGRYLDGEVLCVQSEFSFHGREGDRPFREFDALLQPKGFLLLGLSVQQGGCGEVHGGNLLYLRSVFDVLAHAPAQVRRTRGLKLFVIAATLFHMDTAYVVARALGDAGVVTAPEAVALKALALSHVYLPDVFAPRGWRVRASTLLGNLAALVGGVLARAVSTPKSNRLENYRRLVRPAGRFARADVVERLYEDYYQTERRLDLG